MAFEAGGGEKDKKAFKFLIGKIRENKLTSLIFIAVFPKSLMNNIKTLTTSTKKKKNKCYSLKLT